MSVGFVTGRPTVTSDNRVGVPMLTRGTNTTVYTQRTSAASAIAGTLREGSLVDFVTAGNEVVVPADPAATFHVALTKGAQPVFVTQKYGPELAPRDGEPGAMVAAGWIYAKGRDTITVGDGRVVADDITGRPLKQPTRRYEETYQLAPDVEVYQVDTRNWRASTPSSLQALPVTRDYAYSTRDRQAVFVVFDRGYRQAATARVRQIFYFTPRDVADGKPVWDVPTRSYLLADKGIEPATGVAYADIVATDVRTAPYTRSTEPFEIVPGSFYCVGDNEVSLYLFRCDLGNGDRRLVLLDTGWPNSGYQYWKNIEAVGFDPRDIDYVLMPDGHLRGYGTTVELVTMIENAGRTVELIAPREDVLALQTNAAGTTWHEPGGDEAFLRDRTSYFEFDRWMNFGNVRIRPLWTPGHTAGTTAFVFDIGHNGKRLTFGYMGGYGWSNGTATPANGWRGLGFAYKQARIQQTVDVDHITGQRASQTPVIEVYQALKAYNNDPANRGRPLTMLDALGRDRWVNYPKKRYRVANRRIEALGPYRPGRDADARDLRVKLVDNGQVLRGFKKGEDTSTWPPLLKDGVVIAVDSFVHDAEGWYVQFELKGLDAGGGELPELGPAESTKPAVTEVLRTERFGTKAEAEAVLRSVRAGQTYRVDLTLENAIAVPVDGSSAFKPDR